MTSKQLAIWIGATVILALLLAWVIERTQVRAFVSEWEARLNLPYNKEGGNPHGTD